MAKGDVYTTGIASLNGNNDQSLSFKPEPGTEIVVHNVVVSCAADLYIVDEDADTSIRVDSNPATDGSAAWMGVFLHCTEKTYYQVVSTDGDAQAHADGVYTR